MKRVVASWTLICCIAGMGAAAADEPLTLEWGGRPRSYWLHVPPPEAPTIARPLVIVLHSHGGSAGNIRRLAGMDDIADREGFIVAYPEGTGWGGFPPRGWNAGWCCGYAMNAGIDDVGFIGALMDDIARAHRIDSARRYVLGASNGGMLAHRLACQLSDRVAAIGVIGGTLDAARCEPNNPVSVVMVHGTADRHVRYAGGRSDRARDGRVDPPVADAVLFWVRHNGADVVPERRERGRLVRESYRDGRDGSAVVLYTILEGRHVWPGPDVEWEPDAEGVPPASASEVLWGFFARHPKSEGARSVAGSPHSNRSPENATIGGLVSPRGGRRVTQGIIP